MYEDEPVLPWTSLYIPIGSVVGLLVGVVMLYDALVWAGKRCCCSGGADIKGYE